MSDETVSETTETTENAGGEETPEVETNWYDGMDDVNIGTAQNKGWGSAEEAIKSYREIEKHMGANEDQLLRIPEDPDDEDGWAKFYGKLGRPESPDGYKFDIPEGVEVDPDFLTAFKEQAHAAGLNNEKASKIVGWWNETMQNATTAAEESKRIEQETELAELKKEWGSGFEEGQELGRRAARHFGIDEETLGRLEDTMGTGKLLKLFKGIGDSISEDKMVKSERTDGFGYTLEQAKAEKQVILDALSADPERNRAYIEGKGDDAKRMQKIYDFIRSQEQ